MIPLLQSDRVIFDRQSCFRQSDSTTPTDRVIPLLQRDRVILDSLVLDRVIPLAPADSDSTIPQ